MPSRRITNPAAAAAAKPSRAPLKIPKGPGDPPPPTELDIITVDIKQLHATAAKKSVAACAEIGRLLILARNLVPHGQWGTYLKRELPYNQRTAERAMDLHRFHINHPTLFDKVATLGVTNAYFIVTFPIPLVEDIVSSTHVVPSTGFEKAPADLTDAELFEVILARTATTSDSNATQALLRTYRRQIHGLIKTLKIFIATKPPIDPDALDDLYDDLVDTVARFAHAFSLEADDT